jgi:hypothetical protein
LLRLLSCDGEGEKLKIMTENGLRQPVCLALPFGTVFAYRNESENGESE